MRCGYGDVSCDKANVARVPQEGACDGYLNPPGPTRKIKEILDSAER